MLPSTDEKSKLSPPSQNNALRISTSFLIVYQYMYCSGHSACLKSSIRTDQKQQLASNCMKFSLPSPSPPSQLPSPLPQKKRGGCMCNKRKGREGGMRWKSSQISLSLPAAPATKMQFKKRKFTHETFLSLPCPSNLVIADLSGGHPLLLLFPERESDIFAPSHFWCQRPNTQQVGLQRRRWNRPFRPFNT